jgi:hypothetical protein
MDGWMDGWGWRCRFGRGERIPGGEMGWGEKTWVDAALKRLGLESVCVHTHRERQRQIKHLGRRE